MTTQKRVRTRFAPSPTGNLHIGGARTALFAYAWAKHNSGDFLLRLEDTDKEREKEGSEESFYEGLEWLGIIPDESPRIGGLHAPYKQSERLDIYKKYVQILIESKKAYFCFCTSTRLQEMRDLQQRNKMAPRYDRECRKYDAAKVQDLVEQQKPFVVRLAVPEEGSVTVHDIVRGAVTFDVKDIDDQVLLKSDGFPTYHLANVVDDHLMEITHVIRGEEWLPSAPKHVLLYDAFGWEAPEFVHLSLFLSKEGGKMSKRHGETSLLAFRDNGYLPEAIINFMALLGWNPKTEEEIFSLNALIERFELSMINKANPVFETEKLDWMNQQYMKQLSVQEYMQYIEKMQHISDEDSVYHRFFAWFSQKDAVFQESIWESLKERSKTLKEAASAVEVIEKETLSYDAQNLIWKKSDAEQTTMIIEELLKKLEATEEKDFLRSVLEKTMIEWIQENQWGNGDVLWPMRFALSGEKQSPSPFELAEMMGKEKTLERIVHAKQLVSQL